MRILFVTHRYPPQPGGIETHVREVATRLVERGHDVTVFSTDADSDTPNRSTDNGVRVRRFWSLRLDESFYFAPQLTLAVRRTDTDVIHAHNYHALPLLFAAMGVTDERFVVTTHYHGDSSSDIRSRLLSVYRLFGQWAVQRADEVVAVSEWEREQLREDFDVDATIIPNGINIERFVSADSEKRERPYILCLGRLEKYKGIQHVIRAMNRLPGYDLLVAGTGPYRGELERITRIENMESRVEFLGYVGENNIPSLYAGADVYVTMSEFESYGMTVAEAISAGTPCVVRNMGGLSDWACVDGVIPIQNVSKSEITKAIVSAADTQPCSDVITTWQQVVNQHSQEIYKPQ